MKLSRLSLPFNSPTRIVTKAGRIFIDVVAGVLTARTPLGAYTVGTEAVVNDILEDETVTQAWHNAYVRKSFATACTITIPEEGEDDLFINGTSFIVKNIGAGACTITAENTDADLVTLNGEAAIAQGDAVKVIRVAKNTWDIVVLSVAV